jgi:hypothetical protein
MDLDWQAELVRVSLFSNAPVGISDADWKQITGQDEAATRAQIPGGRALTGQALDAQLSIAQTGPRIDCILTSRPRDATGAYLKIGPFPKTIDNAAPPCSRRKPWSASHGATTAGAL